MDKCIKGVMVLKGKKYLTNGPYEDWMVKIMAVVEF